MNPTMAHEQSSMGGYPYNGAGTPSPRGGIQPPPTTNNMVGLGQLKKPTSLTSAVNGQVGPNPMRPMGGMTPPTPTGTPATGTIAPSFGGLTNSGPQQGMGVSGGGSSMLMPSGMYPPASPQVMPPNSLQPTPPPIRSAGFGGIRPNMTY